MNYSSKCLFSDISTICARSNYNWLFIITCLLSDLFVKLSPLCSWAAYQCSHTDLYMNNSGKNNSQIKLWLATIEFWCYNNCDLNLKKFVIYMWSVIFYHCSYSQYTCVDYKYLIISFEYLPMVCHVKFVSLIYQSYKDSFIMICCDFLAVT